MEDGLRCAGWFFGELNSPPLIYLAFLGRVRLAHNVLFGLVGPWEAIRKLDLYKFTSKPDRTARRTAQRYRPPPVKPPLAVSVKDGFATMLFCTTPPSSLSANSTDSLNSAAIKAWPPPPGLSFS